MYGIAPNCRLSGSVSRNNSSKRKKKKRQKGFSSSPPPRSLARSPSLLVFLPLLFLPGCSSPLAYVRTHVHSSISADPADLTWLLDSVQREEGHIFFDDNTTSKYFLSVCLSVLPSYLTVSMNFPSIDVADSLSISCHIFGQFKPAMGDGGTYVLTTRIVDELESIGLLSGFKVPYIFSKYRSGTIFFLVKYVHKFSASKVFIPLIKSLSLLFLTTTYAFGS